jgi:hypothetical protein
VNTSDEPEQHGPPRSRDLREYVRAEPITSLAIAAGVGFIVGGGASTRPGLALLAFIGRIAVREAATYFIIGAVANGAVGNDDSTRRDFHNRS